MEKFGLLIVDDNDVELDLVDNMLKSPNYNIFRTTSGQEALDHIRKEKIDIVILDVLMPGMDGIMVCREIRKRFVRHPIQILLMSAIMDEPKLNEIIDFGADDFIQKPFTVLEIKTRVRAAELRLEKQLSLIREKNALEETFEKTEKLPDIARENVHLKRAFDELRRDHSVLEEINQKLEKIARFDYLSGLLNRLSLDNQIDTEIERSIRTGTPLTGVIFDVDNFKRINDEYGHPCGDKVIEVIGHCVRKCLRKYDFGGRYGGDEFFVILPDSTLKQGESILNRLKLELEETRIACGDDGIYIKTSFGVAQFRVGESKENWIARADKAMYAAKQKKGY